MKTLIIGSEGEIGQELQKQLNDCVTIDLKDSKNDKHYKLDVRDTIEINKIINKHEINKIFFLSSLLIKGSEENLENARSINKDSLINLFPIIREKNIRVLFTSSIAIYDEFNNLNPITNYGKLKLETENEINRFNLGTNLISIVRLPSLININSKADGVTSFIGKVFNNLKEERYLIPIIKNKKIPAIFLEDAVKGLIEVLDSNITECDFESFSISGEDIEKSTGIKVEEKINNKKNAIALSWPSNMKKERLYKSKFQTFESKLKEKNVKN